MTAFEQLRQTLRARRIAEEACVECGCWIGHTRACGWLYETEAGLAEVRPGQFMPRRWTMTDRIREVTG